MHWLIRTGGAALALGTACLSGCGDVSNDNIAISQEALTWSANFSVTKRVYNTTQPAIQCRFGPLGSFPITTLNLGRAPAGQATHGVIDKTSSSGTIIASPTEFQAIWDAVFPASTTHPVVLMVAAVDQANSRYADVTSVVPR
jgi:hypothetical protein